MCPFHFKSVFIRSKDIYHANFCISTGRKNKANFQVTDIETANFIARDCTGFLFATEINLRRPWPEYTYIKWIILKHVQSRVSSSGLKSRQDFILMRVKFFNKARGMITEAQLKF